MDWDALVLRAGDRVGAWGRLVRNTQGTWFEPPLPQSLVFIDPRPVNPPFRGAVPVDGADMDLVAERCERDGAAEGWATVTGTWSGRGLRVERQRARRDAKSGQEPEWTTPPCPPPPGGWPHGMSGGDPENLEFEPGDLQETGAAVSLVTFRPGRDQAVLVVAAADPAAVEARLRPQLGPRLCVVPSRWAKHDLDRVRGHLRDHWDAWNLYVSGVTVAADAQPCVTACLTRVLPEIATWAASLPPGILTLDPWLVPAHAAG